MTTLRSVGGIQAVDSCLRDKILSGKAVGPRILAGNMAVSVPGGHMAGSLAYEAASPEGAAALVWKIAEDKSDLIKLMITGGVLDAKCKGEPGDLKALRHIDLVMGRGNLIRAPKVKKQRRPSGSWTNSCKKQENKAKRAAAGFSFCGGSAYAIKVPAAGPTPAFQPFLPSR